MTRQIGGRQVIAEQIEHLRGFDADERVEIRVLTWEAGMHDAVGGAFHTFEFSEEGPVVYVPLIGGSRYIEKTQQVAEYRAAFVSLWEQAVPMKEFTP